MNKIVLIKILFFFILIHFVHSIPNPKNDPKRRLKVLVYSPSMGWSHMQFMGKIADTLAEVGHEVHFLKLMVNPSFAKRNETLLAHKVHRIIPNHLAPEQLEVAQSMASNKDSFSGEHFKTFFAQDTNFYQMVNVIVDGCRALLQSNELINELAQEQFDVAISEAYESCPFALFHRIGAKTTLGAFAVPIVSPLVHPFGIPTFASFVPSIYGIGAGEMDFKARAINLFNEFHYWLRYSDMFEPKLRQIVESAFGTNFPSSRQLMRNISMLFANNNPFLAFPRPISNKLVYIGGLVDEDAVVKPLNKKMQQLLDDSNKGAMLVSFGSIANTRKMSPQMRKAMFQAFARFPEYTFIWKCHNQTLQEKAEFKAAKNVHLFEWVDQNAVLRHPKLRAFITHCGQNSLNEALKAGVPVIGIPLFADQLYNSVLAKRKGFGVHLDIRDLNQENGEDLLYNALEKILHIESYQQNAKMISQKLRLLPFSAKDQLVRWVEFAAEFPPLNELNLPDDQELGWFIYYSLDVIFFTIALFGLTILAFLYVLKQAIRWMKRIDTDSEFTKENGIEKKNL